jgi:uncharacterized membrane protein YcfT
MTLGQTGATHSGPAVGSRIDWIDAARGLCVIAVVLFHVGYWHFLKFEHAGSIAFALWETVAIALGSVRMPLLLAVSGMLAASKIRNGFGNGKAIQASLTSFYLYAVWLLVYALLSIPAAMTGATPRVGTVGDFFLQLVVPDTPLWFVFALALYIPLLTLCRKLPPAVVLAALAVVRMLTVLIPGSDSGQWAKVPELAFFFAVGVYGKALLIRLAEVRRLFHAAVAIPAFLALSGLSLALDLAPVADQALFILRGLAAIVALVAVISTLTRNRGIAAAGSWVGKRTLGVYVLHVPVLDGIVFAFQGPLAPAVPVIANSATMALTYPLALTAVVALACIALEYLLKKCGLGFLFSRPQAKTAARHRQPVHPARWDRSSTKSGQRKTPRSEDRGVTDDSAHP